MPKKTAAAFFALFLCSLLSTAYLRGAAQSSGRSGVTTLGRKGVFDRNPKQKGRPEAAL